MNSRMAAHWTAAALAGWAVAAGAPARAAAPVTESMAVEVAVVVVVEDCGARLSSAAVEEALGVELRGAEPSVSSYIGRARPRAHIRCQGDDLVVQVSSDDGVVLRESIRATGLGLTRFVAIAIAESVAARASEAPPAPTVSGVVRSPTPPPQPLPSLAPAPSAPPSLAVWLSAGGAFSWGGTPAWRSGGGSVGVDLVVRALLTVHLEIGLLSGGVDVGPGHVDARAPSAALGLRVGRDLRRLRIEGGVCLRGGAVLWSGRSTDPAVTGQNAVTPWLGPAAELAVATNVTPRLRVRLAAEVGRPVATASADGLGMRFARLDPVWVGAVLALAVQVKP